MDINKFEKENKKIKEALNHARDFIKLCVTNEDYYLRELAVEALAKIDYSIMEEKSGLQNIQ